MHGTYCFLLDGLREELHDEDLKDEVLGTFDMRYADEFTDENNWWAAEGLVLPSGRVLNLAEKDDYRGRDEFMGFLLGDTAPPSQDVADAVRAALEGPAAVKDAFQRAILWAWRVVALDMELRGSTSFGLAEKGQAEAWIDKASAAELEAALLKEIPATLGIVYSGLSQGKVLPVSVKLGTGKAEQDEWLYNYRRRKLSREFELFYGAGCRPFSDTVVTPYDGYRALDIRGPGQGGPVEADNGILFVDIHT